MKKGEIKQDWKNECIVQNIKEQVKENVKS